MAMEVTKLNSSFFIWSANDCAYRGVHVESSRLPFHQFHSTAASIFHLQDNGRGKGAGGGGTRNSVRIGVPTRCLLSLRDAGETVEFQKKIKIPGLDRFTHEINL